MNTINEVTESDMFISWAISKLQDGGYFEYVLERIANQQKAFFSMDRKELLQMLKTKMEKGAIEHGNLLKDFSKIAREQQDEMLDQIGWMMVYAWALECYAEECRPEKRKELGDA